MTTPFETPSSPTTPPAAGPRALRWLRRLRTPLWFVTAPTVVGAGCGVWVLLFVAAVAVVPALGLWRDQAPGDPRLALAGVVVLLLATWHLSHVRAALRRVEGRSGLTVFLRAHRNAWVTLAVTLWASTAVLWVSVGAAVGDLIGGAP